MKITSDLFDAFLKCPTKCYLHSTGQTGSGNAYAEWVREQNDAYRKAMYVWKHRPGRFSLVAIGSRLDFNVLYGTEGFELVEDPDPLG